MADAQAEPHLSFAYLRSGPFISGTTHALLRLGQRLRGGEDSHADAQGTEEGADGARREKPERAQPSRRGRGSVTLKDLIDNGVISAGRNNISVTYKGITYTASLQKDGIILYQGQPYSSATAFSIHCKRLQTPNKQGDDGWKSVLFEGTQLDVFRQKLQAPKKAGSAERDEVAGADDVAVEAAAGQTDTAAATDQWVQCDRCRTWRVVPPEQWPAVEADEREEWLCEYAQWDVAKFQPFKPSCAPR